MNIRLLSFLILSVSVISLHSLADERCTDETIEKSRKAIKSQQAPSGFIDEDKGNDGRFRANPYGNAVDMMALNPAEAKKTLDAWKSTYDWQVKNKNGFQGYYFFYDAGAEPLIDSENDRRLTAQAAWIAMAANDYEKRTGDKSYAKMRDDLSDWMIQKNHNPDGGVSMGRGTYSGDIGYGKKTSSTIDYSKVYATEHNIDAYGALSRSPREKDQAEAAKIKKYMLARYDSKTNMFDGGYNTESERPLDAQTWMVLTLSPQDRVQNLGKFNAALDSTMKKYEIQGQFNGKTVTGLNSGNGDVRGVWAEGTYGMIMALRAMADANEKSGHKDKAQEYRKKADFYNNEMEKLRTESGALVYDTSGVWNEKNGNKPFEHMSGTAWSALTHEGRNPFNPDEKLSTGNPCGTASVKKASASGAASVDKAAPDAGEKKVTNSEVKKAKGVVPHKMPSSEPKPANWVQGSSESIVN